MNISNISSDNLKEENNILSSILQTIDNNESMVFSSGAGSGKTYSLIESLKYIVDNTGLQLKEHNQKIICITYTNVATQEVKERLGNTDIVLISTIHERIWSLIKGYKKELLEIHKEKLRSEFVMISRKLFTEKEFEKFRELSDIQKKNFKNIMIENRNLFYGKYDLKAESFKNELRDMLKDFPTMLNNVNNFKKTVNSLYKLSDYEECCKRIEARKEGYISIVYSANYNRDRLHKMQISHDTLLEYGQKIIEKYDILKKIIIDKYPYIFIDEYQDTNKEVINIMRSLQLYAQKIKHNFYVGYFGDTAQNIYENGIGAELTNIHPDLKVINKKFNRRSDKKIIDVINLVRNDDIKQVPIDDDSENGSVRFYVGTSSESHNFIENYSNAWNISSIKPLHCFVLTNETVAEYSGFSKIYNNFKKTEKYSGQNFNQLNTELLSKDLTKLGEIPKLLFNIIKLKNNTEDSNTPLLNILDKDVYEDMNMSELKSLIKLLQELNAVTLEEYIDCLSKIYSTNTQEAYIKLIKKIFGMEGFSSAEFKKFLTRKLFPNLVEDESEEVIQNLLEIELEEYNLWFNFIMNKQDTPVVYHTYHGTKGLEFENVIIIMENKFGRQKEFFNFFFKNFNNVDGRFNKDRYEKVKNLLYVSCSRAKKNLRIFYSDDISEFKNNIEKIFGEVHSFKKKD